MSRRAINALRFHEGEVPSGEPNLIAKQPGSPHHT